jgi:hypothetical protein
MELYRVHLAWSRFELTTLVVIGTDCIGSHKSNYHTITTMAASDSNDLIGGSPSQIIFWQVMRKWNKIHKKNTTLLEVLKFNPNNSRNRNKMDTTSTHHRHGNQQLITLRLLSHRYDERRIIKTWSWQVDSYQKLISC